MNTLSAQSWTLDRLLEQWVNEALPTLPISGVSLDSRLVEAGDLYLAVGGEVTHGMRYAEGAVKAGAKAVATTPDALRRFPDVADSLRAVNVPLIVIDDIDQKCADIASLFYGYPDRAMTLIAVTGTDGKTSVCRFISQAFHSVNRHCGYIGTLGWGLGEQLDSTELTTPDVVTLRRMLASLRDQGAEVVALEASSHGLSEGRLKDLALDVAVLTNLGRDHLDYHETMEAYQAAKATLFAWPGLSALVLNAGDAFGRTLCEEHSSQKRYVYQSASSADVKQNHEQLIASSTDDALGDVISVLAEQIHPHDAGLDFTLLEADTDHVVSTSLMGKFNVENLLACYSSLRACGLAANQARHGLESVSPVAGRMERFGGKPKPSVVVDYAHTPQALQLAIDSVRVHCQGQLWVVFGCGGDRDPGKRAPMARAAQAADVVVLTDDNPRMESSEDIIAAVLEGFDTPEDVIVIADRSKAIQYAIDNANAGDLVLVAGKGHEDYQTVGTTRLPFSDKEEVLSALEVAS